MRRRLSRALVTGAAVAGAALAAGACKDADEDVASGPALDAAKAYERAIDGDRPRRACDLMTPRAAAQLAAAIDVVDCEEALSGADLDFEPHTPAEFARASVTTGEDRVVIAVGDKGDRIGLRKAGGDWLVDNVVNALDEQPRRPDPRLTKGSDAQQVVATVNALMAALDRRDHERACALYGPRAEAQFVIGLGFHLAFKNVKPPERVTCTTALRRLVTLSGENDPFEQPGSLTGEIDASQVSIRGDRATVEHQGFDALELIRQDGRWLVDGGMSSYSTPEHTAASDLTRCWRRAGAAIASDAGELRFARESSARGTSEELDHVSVKGEGWRIFYALPADGRRTIYARSVLGEDPGLAKVLSEPGVVAVVAYVKNADARADVVARARPCGE